MATTRTGNNDKAVRRQVLRILGERIDDPMLDWETISLEPETWEGVAARQLRQAEYLTSEGYITLAGADYYRRETTHFRWLRQNWFPVAVAAATIIAMVGGPFFDFLWAGVLP